MAGRPCQRASSIVVASFSIVLSVLLARNQTQQDTLDRIKLGGVDERVDANVDVSDKHRKECSILTDGDY